MNNPIRLYFRAFKIAGPSGIRLNSTQVSAKNGNLT